MTGSTPPGANRALTANGGLPSEVLPPQALQDWVGGGGPAAYTATGNEFMGYLVDLCGLQPADALLDVGCGSGRMALPLTGYLTSKGRYAGFDVSREAVAWCKENISGSHPNFDFTVVDIRNGAYNPTGIHKSSDFRFPYPDGSFDVVLLASLFTHMLPSDVRHYLHEIVRVLKPGGRTLITFFLLNDESLALIKEGKASFNFEHEMPGYRVTRVEIPEAAIAYPEDFVRYLHAECGLELREPLRYGTWSGRTDAMSGQDVVVAVKSAGRNPLGHAARTSDLERPMGSSKYPLIALPEEGPKTRRANDMRFAGAIEIFNRGTIAGWAGYMVGGSWNPVELQLRFRTRGSMDPVALQNRHIQDLDGATGFTFQVAVELQKLAWPDFLDEFDCVVARCPRYPDAGEWHVPLYKTVLRPLYSENGIPFLAASEDRSFQALSENDDLYAGRYQYYFSVFYNRNPESLLNVLCDQYGSDKGETGPVGHPYPWPSHTYADFIERTFEHCRKQVRYVFECGIGTNNPNMTSSMGIRGRPGASLRVWRDYFPNAHIFGADIDRDILFQEERISTFYCDQTDPTILKAMWDQIAIEEFDFMVDDGLHTLHAAVCLFENSIHKLKEGGIYVIEDVPAHLLLEYDNYFRSRNFRYEFVNLYRTVELNDNSLVIVRK